ncbi:MFS transporter [Crenobacter sp. SG2303]|uniref:MFS transporter n=1 Tax=Crenobacter oryzisoli TaxID=3056844 RepID=A0ABT7XPG8_9NEIS|nr:MFS transporter [Crenobacter sp. SG2303]MDN0075687.1 MFS transporter [Crenobacter sp. SG2303]
MTSDYADPSSISRSYAWLVFALTFGLLLSDYMSRQVLNAVFPLLKAEWGLSDTQLGSLSSVVALMVGLLTFPLSVLADRWGRVKSIILMASIWGLATLGCALASNFGEMLIARFFVGVGEAAYGSVGIALILSIFPSRLRATLTGAFMAGGAFGSVLGMAIGGMIAVHMGWRWSFGTMAIFGLLLVLAYRLTVTENRLSTQERNDTCTDRIKVAKDLEIGALLKSLFSTRSVRCAYIGSGLQLFVMAAMMAWTPSYLNRYYAMRPDKAGVVSAAFVLVAGMGMVLCGIITDRFSQKDPARKWSFAISYSLISFTCMSLALQLPAGPLQLALLATGVFLVAGTSGPAGAMVARLTPTSIHATAFATLTLANNLLGLAPGPFITGMLADHFNLLMALRIITLMGLLACIMFMFGKRTYRKDLSYLDAMRDHAKTQALL